MTFQLVYWGTYTQIQPKIIFPVYPHAFLSSNNKDLPVTTTIIIIDRFYIALFSAVEQTHCARMWFYMSE